MIKSFWPLLLLLLMGCNRETLSDYNYSLFVFTDEGMKVMDYRFPQSIDQDLNGEWVFKEGNGLQLEKGDFNHGFKEGKWNYKLYYSDKPKNLEVVWGAYSDSIIKCSVPLNWRVVEVNDMLFAAVFDTESELKSNKFFGLLESNLVNQQTFEDFWLLHTRKTFESIDVKNYAHFKINTEQNTYYFSRLTVEDKGEKLYILSFLFNDDDKVYEFVWKTLDGKQLEKQLTFFEIMRNTELNGIKIFPYFSKKLQVEEMDVLN